MSLLRRSWPYLLFFWATLIMILSVIPGKELPSLKLWEADKVMHALVYAILTFLTFQWLRMLPSFKSVNKTAFFSVTLCILYGFIIEVIQGMLPTRRFDLLDELANSIGFFISIAVILVVSSKQK